MYTGEYVFAQVMEYLPWPVFRRCVARYGGDHKIKSFSCLDQFRCLAFAQLTWRESLRDIEACLRAQSAKLYHLGFRCPQISRNTMANANAERDWRIYADFAQHLIRMARELYADGTLPDLEGIDTVYALDLRPSTCACRFFRGLRSDHQGRDQTAYAARSTRQHSVVYLHQRRKNARCEHPRSSRAGSRSLLRHRSRLCRF